MKKRLDLFLHQKYPEYSRRYIQSLIKQGNVTVNGVITIKVATEIKEYDVVVLNKVESEYVSRAGFKLARALESFNISVEGLVALDAGLSTGGFTDCLLQHGIKKVFGVDVGHGQVHEKIKKDQRVHIMEKTNLRHIDSLPELVDLVTLDLSFISVLLVIPILLRLLKRGGQLIVLIKPQFEATKNLIGRGGIIKDSKLHESIVNKVVQGITESGFIHNGTIDSPILGSEGNKEFLAYFYRK